MTKKELEKLTKLKQELIAKSKLAHKESKKYLQESTGRTWYISQEVLYREFVRLLKNLFKD